MVWSTSRTDHLCATHAGTRSSGTKESPPRREAEPFRIIFRSGGNYLLFRCALRNTQSFPSIFQSSIINWDYVSFPFRDIISYIIICYVAKCNIELAVGNCEKEYYCTSLCHTETMNRMCDVITVMSDMITELCITITKLHHIISSSNTNK